MKNGNMIKNLLLLIMMEKVTIVTPENIELEYELANLGSRLVGAVIDHMFQGGIISILFIILILSYPDITLKNLYEIFLSTFAAIIIILVFLVTFGYFIFFETIWSGQTPGKRFADIQVIRDNGEPIRFTEALLRNIFRTVDFLLFYYQLGIILVLFHQKHKRVGDIVANTIVVKVKQDLAPITIPDFKIRTDLVLDPSRISDEDYALIRNFLIRRNTLKPEPRCRIATKLARPLIKLMDMTDKDIDYEEFLEALAVQYRNWKKMI